MLSIVLYIVLFGTAISGVFNTPATVRLRMDLVVLVVAGVGTGQILVVPVVVYLGGGVTGAVSVIAGTAIAAALLHAIIAFRFDTSELGSMWTEICAYGTAVQAAPITEAAKYTASQLGYGAGS